jgi:hypothetical protein
VVIGVDPHKASTAMVVIDGHEQVVGRAAVPQRPRRLPVDEDVREGVPRASLCLEAPAVSVPARLVHRSVMPVPRRFPALLADLGARKRARLHQSHRARLQVTDLIRGSQCHMAEEAHQPSGLPSARTTPASTSSGAGWRLAGERRVSSAHHQEVLL